jgi:hypothetical protein
VNVGRRSHLFEIWIRPISSTAPGNLHDRTLFATRAAWRELAALVELGMSPETLEETKQFLHNYTVNWAATISRRLAYAMDDAFYGMPGGGFLTSIRGGLAGLDTTQVNEAIREHLQYRNMYVVFITANAVALQQTLLRGEPTPITYAGAQSPAHMAEDQEIASYAIPVREENITIMSIDDVFEQ